MGERTLKTTQLIGQTSRTLKSILTRAPIYSWRQKGPAADHFFIIPQDLRTADPSFSTEVYHGHFGLAGTIAVIPDGKPFDIRPPNNMWERELQGFGWLRHLHASQDDIAREFARSIVGDWIRKSSSIKGQNWQPEVCARRVISWLSHAPLFLESASEEDYDNIMRSLNQQIAALANAQAKPTDNEHHLMVLTALMLTGLCLADQEHLIEQFSPKFSAELKRQIFPDGGHVSRNPWVNVELLLDFLPLKQCFTVRKLKPPAELSAAIDRMVPMIQFMRTGDGVLSHFNGMGATLPDLLATVMAYDDPRNQPSAQALQSAYCRLANESTIAIVDAGSAPPKPVSNEAHAGCLSFELSSGTSPVIVNCGAPAPAHYDWRLKSRTTAFHSTVTVGEASSAQLNKESIFKKTRTKTFLSGPDKVHADLKSTAKGVILLASHDGYGPRFGVTHIRKMQLSPDGLILQGEDQLVRAPTATPKLLAPESRFAVRFHIHPDNRVTIASENNHSINIDLPNHERWTFTAKGIIPALEESIFLADYRGPRQTLQIVLRGTCKDRTRIGWVIERTVQNLDPEEPHIMDIVEKIEEETSPDNDNLDNNETKKLAEDPSTS